MTLLQQRTVAQRLNKKAFRVSLTRSLGNFKLLAMYVHLISELVGIAYPVWASLLDYSRIYFNINVRWSEALISNCLCCSLIIRALWIAKSWSLIVCPQLQDQLWCLQAILNYMTETGILFIKIRIKLVCAFIEQPLNRFFLLLTIAQLALLKPKEGILSA